MTAFKCTECGKVTKIEATNIAGYTCTCGTELVIDKPKAILQTARKKPAKKKPENNSKGFFHTVGILIRIAFFGFIAYIIYLIATQGR